MSQNRNYRRNDRQSYQMNAPGGGFGGNRPSQMNVNPWEGGLVPGNPRGGGGLAGLLPTPTQQSSLVSQLSSTEAQLAIASNLLTTLLRPQQPAQPQVPPLLSLGTLGQLGNIGQGFRQQQQFGSAPGRFQDNRRRRLDSRRTEPYNKNAQGRRSTPSKGGPERKPGAQGFRSPVRKSRPGAGSKLGGKADDKEHKDKEEEDKTNGDVQKADEEDGKREEGEGGDDKKRDWKEERKPEDGEIVEEEDKGDGETEEERDDDDDEEKGNRYSGIPNALFFCHVCKKHMWDGNSFESHLKGRTHQLMMDKLEESNKIKVELMRHKLKVAEQQREIEMERMKRQGKKVHMKTREYCTMCDLHFYGHLMVHRRNERHQQLKKFLHPRCHLCKKEFPTRIEWDHHRLTPLHLKKSAEARKHRKDGSDDDFLPEELDSDTGSLDDDFKRKDIKVRTREEEEEDIKEVDKNKEEGDKDEKGEGKQKEGAEDPTPIDELSELSFSNLRTRIPKYNPDVPIGQSALKKLTGIKCRACYRFFLNDDDAKIHCRTLTHYNNYVTMLKTKARVVEARERREAMAEEAKKKAEAKEKAEKQGKRTNEDETATYEEGNVKRRKVIKEDEDGEAGKGDGQEEEKDGENEEESMDTSEADEKKLLPGEEKYDPLEADAEGSPEGGEEDDEGAEGAEGKVKQENEEDNIWAEVDHDIGTLLDTVEGEAEGESGAEVTEDDSAASSKAEGAGAKGKPGTRKAAAGGSPATATATGGAAGSPAAGTRGSGAAIRGGRGRKRTK
ncbi:zinc finger protein on ecdysone puffs-like isoform X1 [Schistocerca gregaria]|uniref:zinc finger protein on ecdysone puffs-like isoform X1 n=1 Tax=Schistocerca gregaria TaxID=7010 RepID=UPI00211F30BD|nr:zinc finger protein on ecdysone puffs-like isoform X1 [Schistocerca gregaria]